MKQKNIVSSPDDKLNNLKINFEVEDKKYRFSILANIKNDEVFPVLDNWLMRTEDYSAKSLVKYINSKSAYGFKAKTL